MIIFYSSEFVAKIEILTFELLLVWNMFEYIQLMKILNYYLFIFKMTENVQGSCHLKLPRGDTDYISTNE